MYFFFFSSRRRHTRSKRDWSSDVCSSDLDEELALGFCLTEGLAPRSAAPPADLAANTIEVFADGMPTARNFYTSSSCGVCGKGALEAVAVEAPHVGSV